MNKGKVLTGFIFIVAGLVVGATFVTAKTYLQLAVAILLYPLLILFFFKVFPRRTRAAYSRESVATSHPSMKSVAGIGAAIGENLGIADIDRRAFLKLIGGAGLAVFLFSIFNKKFENLFPKSSPAPSERNMKTAATDSSNLEQDQPLLGYNITEIDDSIIAFYGFTNHQGAWFIMREDANKGSFRYTKGQINFPGNWMNRTNLKYDYYNNVF